MQAETTRGQGGGWLLLVLALPLCVVCLLYTSDAADDVYQV